MFQSPSWKICILCPDEKFYGVKDFTCHLREMHCKKEGGSFTCHYGNNNLCQYLPLEGVSDRDYEEHVLRIHVKIPSDMSESIFLAPVIRNNNDIPSPPSVVADQQRWTYYHSTVNLPALLNDPAKGKQTDIFIQTWGAEFQKPTSPKKKIPEIGYKHFRSYLKETSNRFKLHLDQAEECPVSTPAPSIERQRAFQLREELSSIPSVFYRSSFKLSDKELFYQVFPVEKLFLNFNKSNNNIDIPNTTTKDNELMNSLSRFHDQLTHQLDLVEMHISSHVAKESSSFFNVMTSHGDIQNDIKKTATAVVSTREKLSKIVEVSVKKNLQLLPLVRKRQRTIQITSTLKLMATVQQTQPTIQLLLSNSDYIGALELIDYTQDILTNDLIGVKAFRHLGPQLEELRKVIDVMVDSEIRKYFHEDISRPLSEDEALVSNPHILSQLIQALLHLQKHRFLDVYRKECLAIVAPIFKTVVIASVSQCDNVDIDTRNSSITDQMRQLDFNSWMSLFNEIIAKMTLLLKRVHSCLSLVLEEDRKRVRDSDNQTQANVDSLELQKNVKQTLICLCDQTHERCKKLLVSRSKDGFFERLSMSEFVRFTRILEEFATGTEGLMNRKGPSVLRSAIASSSVSFVSKFHEDQKAKLILLLESERWKPADVPAEFQHLLTCIEEEGFFDTVSCNTQGSSDQIHDCLTFKSDRYQVVGTVLMLLKMLTAYCQLVQHVPALAPDILVKVVDVLKLFNSKSCQLILGAGAIKIVNLKSITSKNLALCATCLKFVLAILPDLRRFFQCHLATNRATFHGEISQVEKDFEQHFKEIVSKLYQILENTIDGHVTKCIGNLKPPAPSSTMKNLTAQIGKFHQSVWNVLPNDVSVHLFTQGNQYLSRRVPELLESKSIKLDSNSNHILLLTELKFYQNSINKLDGLEGLAVDKSLLNS